MKWGWRDAMLAEQSCLDQEIDLMRWNMIHVWCLKSVGGEEGVCGLSGREGGERTWSFHPHFHQQFKVGAHSSNRFPVPASITDKNGTPPMEFWPVTAAMWIRTHHHRTADAASWALQSSAATSWRWQDLVEAWLINPGFNSLMLS